MRFFIVSVGTRGDMEPFLAIAQLLLEKGHEVTCAFPQQFGPLVEDERIRFLPLSPRFIELVEGPDGQLVMGGNGSLLKKIRALKRLYKEGLEVNQELVEQQHRMITDLQPDRVIFSGKSSYGFLHETLHPGSSVLVSPVPCLIHTVKDRPHLGFKGNIGPLYNRLTYRLANYGLLQNILSVTKGLRKASGITARQLQKTILQQHMAYAISPALFPRPAYWPPNAHITGYHERDKATGWTPGVELPGFIQQHPKFLFITFGSMLNSDPPAKIRMFVDILQHNGIPAIINTAAGGLPEPENYDKGLLHFVQQIPYDWIFPKAHAVIHHGGSGTTHTALKYGCASMIIPHIIDQFLWNELIFEKGAGPKGPSVRKLARTSLEPKLLDLFHNPLYRENAGKIAVQMQQEDFTEAYYRLLVGEGKKE